MDNIQAKEAEVNTLLEKLLRLEDRITQEREKEAELTAELGDLILEGKDTKKKSVEIEGQQGIVRGLTVSHSAALGKLERLQEEVKEARKAEAIERSTEIQAEYADSMCRLLAALDVVREQGRLLSRLYAEDKKFFNLYGLPRVVSFWSPYVEAVDIERYAETALTQYEVRVPELYAEAGCTTKAEREL